MRKGGNLQSRHSSVPGLKLWRELDVVVSGWYVPFFLKLDEPFIDLSHNLSPLRSTFCRLCRFEVLPRFNLQLQMKTPEPPARSRHSCPGVPSINLSTAAQAAQWRLHRKVRCTSESLGLLAHWSCKPFLFSEERFSPQHLQTAHSLQKLSSVNFILVSNLYFIQSQHYRPPQAFVPYNLVAEGIPGGFSSKTIMFQFSHEIYLDEITYREVWRELCSVGIIRIPHT
jgi:hypothetical protein